MELEFRGDRTAKFFKDKIGKRVAIDRATDAGMRGDRYGEVRAAGRKLVQVKLDLSGRTEGFHPQHLALLSD